MGRVSGFPTPGLIGYPRSAHPVIMRAFDDHRALPPVLAIPGPLDPRRLRGERTFECKTLGPSLHLTAPVPPPHHPIDDGVMVSTLVSLSTPPEVYGVRGDLTRKKTQRHPGVNNNPTQINERFRFCVGYRRWYLGSCTILRLQRYPVISGSIKCG